MKNTVTSSRKPLFSDDFLMWTERVAYVLFCLCILDCSLTGAGRYFEIGSLSPRIIVGFLALFFLLPKIFCNLGKLLKNPVFITFLVFLAYLAICAVRGYLAGNMREVWISDIKGFMWLFLVPVAVLTVNTPSRLDKILNCVMAGSIGQVILVFVATTVCAQPHGIRYLYHDFLAMGIGELFTLTSDITRVFLRSCPYMVFACSIALFKQIRNKKIDWLSMVTMVLCLCACLLSFTRSLFGCIFVVAGLSVVCLLIFYRQHWRRFLACILLVVIGFSVVTFSLEQIFDARFTAFAVCRTLGIPFMELPPEETVPPTTQTTPTTETVPPTSKPPATKPTNPTEPTGTEPPETTPPATKPTKPTEPPVTKPTEPPVTEPEPTVDHKWEIYEKNQLNSVNVRETTLTELTALIKKAPIFGNGLGASAPSRNGPDEYFYHDILARMGIVGLLLYLVPFFYVLVFCFRKRKVLVELPLAFAVICGMCGFWAITFFNPWMNAALGIAMYALYSSLPGVVAAKEAELSAETAD